MTSNPTGSHFTLAILIRIYEKLSSLIGQDNWQQKKSEFDQLLEEFKAKLDNNSIVPKIYELLGEFDNILKKLGDERRIQQVISDCIKEELHAIAELQDCDQDTIDRYVAGAFAIFRWEVDQGTIPHPGDDIKRTLTLSEAGVGGGKSLKFKNLRLDLDNFAKIALVFALASSDLMDKPHPIMITAVVLITLNEVCEAMIKEISEQEASVFWGMVQLGRQRMSETKIQSITNEERAKYGMVALSEQQVRYSLTKLTQIHAIENQGDSYRIIEDYTIEV